MILFGERVFWGLDGEARPAWVIGHLKDAARMYPEMVILATPLAIGIVINSGYCTPSGDRNEVYAHTLRRRFIEKVGDTNLANLNFSCVEIL